MGLKDITTSKLEETSFGSFLGKELPSSARVRKVRGATAACYYLIRRGYFPPDA